MSDDILTATDPSPAEATAASVPPPDRDAEDAAFVQQLRRKARRQRTIIQVVRVLLAVAALAAWEVFSGEPGEPWVLIDDYYLSTPSAVWAALWEWISTGILWGHVLITLQETVIGFLIGATLGLVVGFTVGVNRLVGAALTPFITAAYSIPRLALVPLFLLWFGLGIASKLALVATIVFFLVFYNTYSGVRDVDEELIDTLRVMNARRRHIWGKVVLPSAMTWILTGLGISAPYALVGAVTAEMISSNRGMGYLLVRSSGQFYTAGVFAAILVMILLSVLVNTVVWGLESWLLRWKRAA